MKIVFFEVMPGEQDALTALLPRDHEIHYSPEILSSESIDLARDADIVSVFVKSKLDAALLNQLPHLKLIATRSMGYDHIDVAHATTRGIHTTNVTTYASHPVAEFTFALLLNLTRRIYQANHQLRTSANFDIQALRGSNLFKKTIGVVGTGNIGRNVIAIAQGFGMGILAFDEHPDTPYATELGFTYTTLKALVAQSDIISLHVPHTPTTHHLFDEALFACMKRGALLINTSRGEIIDTYALIAALRNGIVAGAGLDVLESEDQLHAKISEVAAGIPEMNYKLLTANHALIDMPNVTVTPHIAFETTEALAEIARSTAESIRNFIENKDQHYL